MGERLLNAADALVALVPPLTSAIAVLKVWTPVKVCAASVRAIVAVVVGNVMVVLSVPASVRVLLAAKVLALVIVSVPVLAVIPSPLMLVWFASATAMFAVGRTPLTSAVSETAELVTVCVDPTKCAIPAPGEDALTTVDARLARAIGVLNVCMPVNV